LTHANCIFSGDYISAFGGGGCWPLKFLHTLEIDQGMLAHPRAALRWALPHISSFRFIRHAVSELPRPIAAKLCRMIAIWMRFIMQVQKFGGPSPKEIGGQKHAKFGAISDNFRLQSRISPERDKMSKIGKKSVHRRFLPRSMKKVR